LTINHLNRHASPAVSIAPRGCYGSWVPTLSHSGQDTRDNPQQQVRSLCLSRCRVLSLSLLDCDMRSGPCPVVPSARYGWYHDSEGSLVPLETEGGFQASLSDLYHADGRDSRVRAANSSSFDYSTAIPRLTNRMAKKARLRCTRTSEA
jgi:hypothetical protein